MKRQDQYYSAATVQCNLCAAVMEIVTMNIKITNNNNTVKVNADDRQQFSIQALLSYLDIIKQNNVATFLFYALQLHS